MPTLFNIKIDKNKPQAPANQYTDLHWQLSTRQISILICIGNDLPTRPGPLIPRPGPLLPRPGPLLPRPGPARASEDLPTRPGPLLPRSGPLLPRPGPLLPRPGPARASEDLLTRPGPLLPRPGPARASEGLMHYQLSGYLQAHHRVVHRPHEIRHVSSSRQMWPGRPHCGRWRTCYSIWHRKQFAY